MLQGSGLILLHQDGLWRALDAWLSELSPEAFVALLRVPQRILAPLILLFCIVGAYSLQNSAFDVMMVGIFGVAGFLMRLVRLDPAPFMLAFVLGELLEKSLRQALLLGMGSPHILIEKPISAALLAFAALVLLWPLLRLITNRRRDR